ncbi:MAG: hypothetical protein C7B47_12215 [Sulfobacillus thermosulfidooxidans]|uniref:Uncharacterized protein n=1 Tax=Sulfobacillus thermosulfidooxidans TaxID=28034 RepID=A0A2T2WT41_SULTH|nr:MAG: hypothetical protein C7B47_12215 [Sulfobacillus thermosulfidooxidans]
MTSPLALISCGVDLAQAREWFHQRQKLYVGLFDRIRVVDSMDIVPAPMLLDATRAVEMHLTPIVLTGLAHRDGKTGQIGRGMVDLPLTPFTKAVDLWYSHSE